MTKEVAMSDLTLIAEDILNTMQALSEACHAAKEMGKVYQVPQTEGGSGQMIQNVYEDPKLAAFGLFRNKMLELHERLNKLKIVLDNEEAYAVDELVDAISMATTGHRADYRRTPRMHD
jgi:hypothetical protein